MPPRSVLEVFPAEPYRHSMPVVPENALLEKVFPVELVSSSPIVLGLADVSPLIDDEDRRLNRNDVFADEYMSLREPSERLST